MEQVYLNNQITPAEKASISIHDTGILHGVGLFETMRSYSGKVFRLRDHLDRLFYSAEKLDIAITQPRTEIEQATEKLLQANNLKDARIRLTLTRGNIRQLLEDENDQPQSTLFITASALTAYPEEYYKNGILTVLANYKQNPNDPLTGHKTINYFNRLIALHEARKKNAGEALWFTPANRLAEACMSNVFLVVDDKLVTPKLDTPVLPGITRQAVIQLAEKEGLEVQQREVLVNDIMSASEMLLTNSIMEIMPAKQFEAHVIGTGTPGEIFKLLSEKYRQAVARECFE